MRNQKGAALLVSLIMLLLLTMIGIASIEDTALQSNMARNSQFRMQTFNLSFSEGQAQYEKFFDSIAILQDQFGKSDPHQFSDAELVMNSIPDNKIDVSATLSFVNAGGAALAQNTAQAVSMDLVQSVSYEINPVAELKNTSTKSDQIHGLDYIAPK